MTEYPNLQARFPVEASNIMEIHERDIINMCRDTFKETKELKEERTQELLTLLKSKEWNWSFVSNGMMETNMLYNPVYFNVFSIVKYLLETKKYDITQYDETVSDALCACIKLESKEMQDYLLTYDLHTDYLADLAVKCYVDMSYQEESSKYHQYYIDQALILVNKNASFEKMVHGIMNHAGNFEMERNSFIRLLEDHPVPIQDKIKIIDKVLKEPIVKGYGIKEVKDKITAIENWKIFYRLHDTLPNSTTPSSKVKI